MNARQTRDTVDWGTVNKPIAAERFEAMRAKMASYLQGREVFVQDLWAGADPTYRLPVRLVTPSAWHALFAETLFIKPGSASDAGDGSWKHDWTVINAGTHKLTAEQQAASGWGKAARSSIDEDTAAVLHHAWRALLRGF